MRTYFYVYYEYFFTSNFSKLVDNKILTILNNRFKIAVHPLFLTINFLLPSSLLPDTNDSNFVKCYCFVGYRQTKKQDRNK